MLHRSFLLLFLNDKTANEIKLWTLIFSLYNLTPKLFGVA